MNQRLASAVIASFRDPNRLANHNRLQRFNRREWRHTLRWLDVSGLALYFLVRLKSLSIESAIPSFIVAELEQRLADNRLTSAILFQEFVRLNHAFQSADLPYLNLKGFTLVPEYCPASALRYQLDCDFLVARNYRSRCTEILGDLGYLITSSSDSVIEFKAGSGGPGHINNLYKPKSIRSVEIHLCVPELAGNLAFDNATIARRRSLCLNGFSFPALCPEDMFVAQAAHLLRHVRSEWTRLSWLLEFRNFVLNRRFDDGFWVALQESSRRIPNSRTAIAVAVSLATKAFGEFAPELLTGWLTEGIPPGVDLWLKRFGDVVLLTDYPGTKLYLLLNRELDCDQKKTWAARKRVFPLHAPARVTFAMNADAKHRMVAMSHQCRYFLFRLRFHIKETSRYLFELWRWKRLLNKRTHSLSSERGCTVAVEG